MLIEVTGLVIREVSLGESDKILTVLTSEMGKITVYANGVRKYKNPNMNAAQLMSYSEMVVFKRGEKYWLRESVVIENFYDIRLDLERFALAQYILDVTGDVCVEEENEEVMLKLTLNTLYMLVTNKKPIEQVKSVFELRTMANIGFLPNLINCETCGEYESEFMFFDIIDAVLFCKDCNNEDDNTYKKRLPIDVIKAMRHIIYGEPKQIFSFKLDTELLYILAETCEIYLLNHIERGFKTLSFYKGIRGEDGYI